MICYPHIEKVNRDPIYKLVKSFNKKVAKRFQKKLRLIILRTEIQETKPQGTEIQRTWKYCD